MISFFLLGCDDGAVYNDNRGQLKQDNLCSRFDESCLNMKTFNNVKYEMSCRSAGEIRDRLYIKDYDYDYSNNLLTIEYKESSVNKSVKSAYINPQCLIKPFMSEASESEKKEYRELLKDRNNKYVLYCKRITTTGFDSFYVSDFKYDGKQLGFVDNDTGIFYKFINPDCKIRTL